MSLTYNEILDSMKAAFQQEKGEPVANLSDLELRFKAVASEIYSVCAYGDYIFRQGFPQTATGMYLDRHAQLRSITRKKAARASGELTFSLSEAASKSVTIPAGTICSAAGRPFIQFATDKRAIISAGSLSVSVPATALRTGQEHNVEAGCVTDMVNPPDYVFSVTNDEVFTGGWNDESDEALRERILSSYSSRKNAVSAEGVREILLSLDEITDALVISDKNSSVNICLKTRNGRISSSLQTKVSDLLGFLSFCSVEINFIAASEKEFSVKAEAKVLS
ncbi:MAG: baseplate J/gp47 family protein, partial [Eubacterium sp.]|nr:baseplate J/gp47 family protein [Eubacterium sp.]